MPTEAARILTGLITLREQVVAPILAGLRKRKGRPPNSYTKIDRDYDTLRTNMRTLFEDLRIGAAA